MLLWSAMSWLGATVTLAGLVGLVVSIGIAVDSSVVAFEGLKEDVRNGATVRSVTQRSLTRSYSTVVKADTSSLIGAAVLYWLSVGPVRGFAFYLGTATLLDLFSHYFVLKPGVMALARPASRSPKLLGIAIDDLEPELQAKLTMATSHRVQPSSTAPRRRCRRRPEMSSTETEPGGPVTSGPIVGKKMGLLKQLYRDSSDINFPRLFRFTGVVSAVLVAGLSCCPAHHGPQAVDRLRRRFCLGDSFADTAPPMRRAQVLADKGIEGGEIQEATTADGKRILRVTGSAQSVQEGADTAVAFSDAADIDTAEVTVNTVGPSWGEDISRQAGKSLIVFMALVAVYITWSMEARMAFAALVAVAHDIVITLGVFSLFQLTITPATVISFLTILGFSLYDTIVVYDRVQENGDRLLRTGRYTYAAVMRRSLNQVAMRSINTSVTTVLPIISMLVVGKLIFGQQSLADFSLALLIGLLLGTYSSMFVASPLTTVLKEREQSWREVRTRLANKGIDTADTAWYGIGTDTSSRAGAPTVRTAATTPNTSATTEANLAETPIRRVDASGASTSAPQEEAQALKEPSSGVSVAPRR